MLDLSLLAVCVMFAAVGFLSPFVWALGYVWVDTLVPHRLSYSLLTSVPIAFIMGGAALAAYLIQDRRALPRLTAVHVLCFVMAAWITLTTSWAVVDSAWVKWDNSVKTVLFAAFMPFVFRSRVQIESFIMVFALAASAHLIPWGVKTMLTGGGYRQSLGLMSANATWLSESSAVSIVVIMFIPLLLWFRKHSLLVPWTRARTWFSSSMTVLYLFASIGTFARTGVIAMAMLGGSMLLQTRRKVLFLVIAGVLGGGLMAVTSDRWFDRINTISDYENESSAFTRILIWKWTLGYVAEHPLGGGFNVYLTNVIVGPPGLDGKPSIQYGRAFHNIYFAALGEHGYLGLALYLAIMSLSLMSMRRVRRQCRGRPDLEWAGDLAQATLLGFAILLVCGNFIDISFNYLIWNMVSLTMCLTAHVHRALNPVMTADERFKRQRELFQPGGDALQPPVANRPAVRPATPYLR